jgi:hypothetical protein
VIDGILGIDVSKDTLDASREPGHAHGPRGLGSNEDSCARISMMAGSCKL